MMATHRFSWTPTHFSPVRLLFVANDSVGEMSVLHPEVRLCGCALHLNATCADSREDGGENRFIIQNCNCGSGKSQCPILGDIVWNGYVAQNKLNCYRMGGSVL